MPFITPQELRTAIHSYQVVQITEADSDIVLQAIAAAETELRSYLLPNNRKQWQDGRPRYDAAAALSATGNLRNALLMETCKNMAVWYLIRLANVDILYDQAKERYDRAIAWLEKLAAGDITLDLPLLPTDDAGIGSTALPFRAGSRTKFAHE